MEQDAPKPNKRTQVRAETQCFTIHLPKALIAQIKALGSEELPGLPYTAAFRTLLAVGLSADRKTFRMHVGRY
jgi:hypothetical protein